MKKDWTYKKLGEVGTVITGSTPSTKDNMNYSSQDVCFFKPSDLSSDSLVKLSQSEFYISKHAFEHSRKLPKGSVLTTCIGIIGKVGILTEEATCNQQINAIIPNPDIIISDFLGYSIISKKHILQASANAPVVPLLNKTQFSDFSIPIPPLSIQRSIVAELDLLHSVISKKKEQLRALDNLAQSLFYQMFGDPITNPMGWEIKKFAELYKLKSGDGLSAKMFENGPYPVYGGNGISGQHCSYNMDGNYIIIGRVGVYCGNVRNVVGKFWLTDNAFQLFYDEDNNNPIFVTKLLTYLNLNQYANQAAQPVISNLTLKDILVPLPPLSLQQSFAAKVSAIEAQKQAITQSIKDVESLLAQRMDHYFG